VRLIDTVIDALTDAVFLFAPLGLLGFSYYLSYSVMMEFYFGVRLFVEPCVGVYGVIGVIVGEYCS